MRSQILKKSITWTTLFIYMMAFVSPAAQAAPGALANVPLFLATPVQPNVMIMIDNSGSMDNIIWATGYNNSVTYPSWGGANTTPWTADDGNVILSNINQGPCVLGWKRGNNGTTTKCLRLPDPVTGGNTRYTGNYLNYLFDTNPTNTNLTTGIIPNDFRMNVARTVATNLVTTTAGMRFGIASFDPAEIDDGGVIRAACGSTTAALTTAIAGLTSATWTPLAEAYYEITRYFRGMRGFSNTGITHASPVQYRCQKNFTVIVTDGLPTFDNRFPTNDPDDVSNTTRALPNWDNLAPNTTAAMYPTFPPYSDGFNPAGTENEEAFSLYLDDVAKFAYDIDLRKAPATDLTGASFDAVDFPKQTLNTYTVGFSVANQILQDAATAGDGQYFTATDAASLTTALQNVVTNIASRTGSAAAVAFNTATLGTTSTVYQAKFNSGQWSGELLAYDLNDTTGDVAATATWNAATQLDAQTSRTILSYNATNLKGIPFLWDTTASGLSITQQNDLNMSPAGTADAYGAYRLAFLRGNRSLEGATATTTTPSLRARDSRLGDIVHSNPVYVGKPTLGYSDTLPGVSVAYSTFKTSTSATGRTPVVYVGANDGMLHGFNATTGDEVMAYVPHSLFSATTTAGLHYLTNPAYAHLYYVDLAPTVSDVYIKTTPAGTPAWATVLIGGLGAGGRGLFALDITDPSTFAETPTAADNTVMWEFTNADDSNLGYTLSKPIIALMNNNRWAAIVSNGYNDTATTLGGGGEAKLFILYLDGGLDGVWTPGTDYREITTKAGDTTNRNGLAEPALADLDGNGTTDRVYAGDLQGNMWAFDLSNAVDTNWDVAYKQATTPKPLFTALNAAGAIQPITTKPALVKHPTIANSSSPSNLPNLLVLFGTGQYLVSTDPTTTTTQTFYGVWDKGDKERLRSHLVAQTFLTGFPANSRVLSDNAVNYASKYGWYIELDIPAAITGERMVVNPIVRGDYVFFNTMIPNTAACGFGGSSWLMSVKLTNGGRPDKPAFDNNNDNIINVTDNVTNGTITVPPAGHKIDSVAAASSFLGNLQYTSNSGNTLNKNLTDPGKLPGTGRLSWKDLSK